MRICTAWLYVLLAATAVTFSCGAPVSEHDAPGEASLHQNRLPFALTAGAGELMVGVGIADMTGPMVGLATMGYAAPPQETSGLQQRLWARSYVIAPRSNDSEQSPLIYTLTDSCLVTHAMKAEVIRRLKRIYGERYDHSNVMITATHTHAGPGGYSSHGLYNQPSGGFSPENFEIMVSAIVRSIESAHDRLQPGDIRVGVGRFSGVTRNRSLAAYLRNPQGERARFAHDTDDEATLLRFDGSNGKPLGLLHWYAAHATSIDKTNNLISGDNKGFAAWRFETEMGMDYRNGHGFVAGFANSNAGDASPNIAGPVKRDGSWGCDARENFACAAESGNKHFQMARGLFDEAKPLSDTRLAAIHRFTDFSAIRIPASLTGTGRAAQTCTGAIGISMLAGSEEDGPGIGREGVNCSTGGILARQRCRRWRFSCHGEKPVVIQTGRLGSPYTMTPNVLPTQIFIIGNVALLAVPSEFTTMAGRRLREHVASTLSHVGVDRVVIAGYANAYSNYVTTREEYQAQHYEGASTLFGEWTLAAYQHSYGELAEAIRDDRILDPGREPGFGMPRKRAHIPRGVDRVPLGRNFGDVLNQPQGNYGRGQTVTAAFQASNLNHGLRRDQPYLEVQRWHDGRWQTVAYDWDFTTRVTWDNQGLSRSRVGVSWETSLSDRPGTYRLLYRGWANTGSGNLRQYHGLTHSFTLH